MHDEVTIVGAGIVGCATAYFLARAGVRVTVADPCGVAAGASGRNNGLVEHPYDEATAALYAQTVELLGQWLGDAMPTEPVGVLLLADDEGQARGLHEHYARFSELEARLLAPDQAVACEPLLAGGLWGCLLATGHPISPRAVTAEVARLARQAGARFALGERLELAALLAAGGEVVIAAGAASGALLAEATGGALGADAVTPLWGLIVLVELPKRPRVAIVEGTVTRGLTGGVIENRSPFTLLDSPSWLAVGSTLLEEEPAAEEWAARLLERGGRFVPSIARAQVRGTLACARPKSFDGRPLLGRVPGRERLWLASGHGGRGMSLGPASGRLLAEAIMAGSDAPIPAPLRASRLTG